MKRHGDFGSFVLHTVDFIDNYTAEWKIFKKGDISPRQVECS